MKVRKLIPLMLVLGSVLLMLPGTTAAAKAPSDTEGPTLATGTRPPHAWPGNVTVLKATCTSDSGDTCTCGPGQICGGGPDGCFCSKPPKF